MIQGQLADDRTKKGMEKISAVVDSGAEANAIPEKVTQRIPLKPQSRARCAEDPEEIPSIQKKGSVTGRTDEGQRRRIVWEGFCPAKRPLLRVAKITKARDKSTWERQGQRREQQHGADHESSSRAQREDARRVGEETSGRNGCVEFSEAGPLRTCAGTTATTMGPVPVRPQLAQLDWESAKMEDGKGREDEWMQEEAEEGRKLLFRKSDREPSSHEVHEHMKTLISFRSWCDQRISGRGRNDPHRSGGAKRGPRNHPHLAMRQCIPPDKQR